MACYSSFWTMTIGDLATWVGGLASAAAAFAAWWAAREATNIAKMPIEQARRDRLETASIFARAIADEMKDIEADAEAFPGDAAVRYATDWKDGHVYLRSLRLNPMLATSRAVPFINCFGTVHAALVMNVIAAKGKFDDRVARLGSLDGEYLDVHGRARLALHDAAARADELAAAAKAAAEAMSLYQTRQ